MIEPSAIQEEFSELFGSTSRVFRAPGRVNLIGEHTDYNDGFVMPAAIEFATLIAAAPRLDRRLVVRSEAFPDQIDVDLDHLPTLPRKHWSDYVLGVAHLVELSGLKLTGANLLVRSDLPIGGGLSSSAAIEIATALALLGVSELQMDRLTMARIGQRAEAEAAGARVGIMDQFVSCFGVRGHALALDCRSLEFEAVPIPADVALVICNTMVRHALSGGEYNQRRADCEEGVRALQAVLPGITALRDVTMRDLEEHRELVSERVYRRCRHVISENARVGKAAEALQRGDLSAFGQLMAKSHHSLRDDYEVSCPELDVMVEAGQRIDGCLGSRMTGGGFGGCTVNIVSADAVSSFRKHLSREYSQATGRIPEIYVSAAAEHAGELLI
jgi:galactokinase